MTDDRRQTTDDRQQLFSLPRNHTARQLLDMASEIPAELVSEEMEKRKKDEDVAQTSFAGDNAARCASDVQTLNNSAQGGSNVIAPVLSYNTVERDIHVTTHNHHYGAGTSTATQPAEEQDTTSIITEYKESIRSSYEKVKEYNRLPGENVLLTERYTELLMVECYREPGEKEKEMRARGEQHQEVLKSAANSKITVDQFFRPDDRGSVPKAVILQGNSGYGKSFTAQRIMLDWASGTLFKDSFDLVLHLKCKEINEIAEECSLVDLLKYSRDFTSDTADVLRDPKKKLLILVDGFDELRFSVEDDESPPPKDPFEKAPVQATMEALFKGHILRKCKLLLTTRSTATKKLSDLVTGSRFVDILGFDEESVKEYLHRFFCNKPRADELFRRVKNNETLYTACFIPVICWVTCTLFREQIQDGAHITTELETATSIFSHFVSTLHEHHSQDLSLSVPDLLSSLGKLAEKGMQEQRVLFSKKDVLSVVSDPDKVPFLCKFLVKKKVKQEEMFSFMHLSFQEFFTALHYIVEQDGEKLKGLLDSYNAGYWQSHRWPVIQFLFGLVNTELIENLDDLQLTPYTSSIRSHLEEWIKKRIQRVKSNREWALFILHCLYELHEEDFVRKVMNAWDALSFGGFISLTRMDCWVLRYCLLCCSSFKRLEFYECRLTDEILRMLQPALSKCEELRLHKCYLLDSSCSSLAAALRSNSSSLRHLDLSGNEQLGDSGVKLLLHYCDLPDSSCSSLAAALRSDSSSLRHLHLNYNTQLGDSGVKLLSTGLEHPNCRLETLELQECDLPDSSCSSLAAALRSDSSSLRHLHLSGNRELGDSGVKLLSTGLEHPNCRLETLK
ncbi:NACHT, LRR and PYD domains-containing protein 3-like [Engraulis encrasicolus]|uniref:NACHT, LRR and PYD domains-containing protein 3-like n=1 Tax=Engraulis encrasicolus TaxID=184585 RepID=UPI002FD383E7